MKKSRSVIALMATIALAAMGVVMPLKENNNLASSAAAAPEISYRASKYKVGNVGLTIRDASQLPANSTYKLNGIGGEFPASAGGVFLEYGEYPRSYVGDTKNAQLEQLYATSLGNGIRETGKTYTSNDFDPRIDTTWVGANTSGRYEGRESKEYEYNGKKYVRHEVRRYTDVNTIQAHTNAINDAGELFNDDSNENSLFTSGTTSWFTVEPIRWIIANWAEMPKSINPKSTAETPAMTMQLLAVDQIMAGISHGQNASGEAPYDEVLWKNSQVRTFMNGTVNDETRTGLANVGATSTLGDVTGAPIPSTGEVVGNPLIVDAFTQEQRALITTQTIRNNGLPTTVTTVTVPNRCELSTEQYDSNFTTEDKLFLLSYRQVFGTPDEEDGYYRDLFAEGYDPTRSRIAANTDWAFGNFAWSNDTTASHADGTYLEECNLWGAGAWWLRTSYSVNRISRVFYNGEEYRCYTYNLSYGMRPAMYLSIQGIESAVNKQSAVNDLRTVLEDLSSMDSGASETAVLLDETRSDINNLVANLDYFNRQQYVDITEKLSALNSNQDGVESFVALANELCDMIEEMPVLSDFVASDGEGPENNDDPLDPLVIAGICLLVVFTLGGSMIIIFIVIPHNREKRKAV